MTQHFGSGFPVPRNDFTMMNNNYMPQRNIVSFTGRTGQLNGLRSPQILHNTASQPNADLSPNNIAEPLLVQGCSATWQHVVPQRMPWQTTAPLVPNQLGINVFTGSSTSTMCSMALPSTPTASCTALTYNLGDPVPSCSGFVNRPKRRHPVEDNELSPSSKIHLTEEKITNHLQGLRIHATSPPLGHTGASHALGNTPDIITAANQENQQNSSCYQQYQQQQQQQDFSQGGYLTTQWQNYQDLENRLSLMDEDLLDAEETPMSSGSTQPRLHVNIDSLPRAIETRPVVPKAILDKIMNPCRDLVLWSAPGNKLQEKTDEKGDSEENTVDSAACKAESGLPGQAGIEVSDMADDSMEVEAEYIDEDFDL
ncbi:uncharacterized protein LOC128232314 isoform X2 [Mya arenaria]|uniref:uncharacterized protein LOC128232314 isoform X2 n=1 Tax=Mya arenaria TaxID=6604 RepID=UPI0022E7F445|nr:uncharacterized protein LOC128232314 isoform X2 [Mya arenaria]